MSTLSNGFAQVKSVKWRLKWHYDVQKALNDKLKSSSINIGLNDRIAFIKHLFAGNAEDYERVLSQLNTSESYEEATTLIQNIIKPDYDHWEGKEDYETRFLEIIEGRFS